MVLLVYCGLPVRKRHGFCHLFDARGHLLWRTKEATYIYIYIAGPTKSLLHQTLVLKAGSLQNWLVVPGSHSYVPKFPVPTTAHKFINHYCLLPLLLAFKSNEKPNFAAFWSFHYSGKVSIEISCCFCSESKPGKYTIYIYIFVCLYLESKYRRPYFPG